MSPKKRKRRAVPEFITDLGMHGAHKRFPDGRKLSQGERECLPLIASLNAEVVEATVRAASKALAPDTTWLLHQFLNPISLASRKGVKLPDRGLLLSAIAFLEDSVARDHPDPACAPPEPAEDLTAAIDEWAEAFTRRAQDKRWKDVTGTPVTREQLRNWQTRLADMHLRIIPLIDIPAEFERALTMVEAWDDVLAHRGHIGERFSLREEVVRLHNWPGDQWINGDDYASAQKRFHRRLRKARKLSDDPIRDEIMQRALYLREGLLLGPVDPLQWFLAVCQFRWAVPEMLDVRPELMTWRFVDWVARLSTATQTIDASIPRWAHTAEDPRDVPARQLTAVSGPNLMINLDEDVVTALPPGCRVRRLIVSAQGPLGPDWTVYWVESEWEDSRPILDLVESAKLHPKVVFVSDERPDDLAELIRPFLPLAYEIPTHSLSAHSHTPGAWPSIPDHPDAGL